MTERTWDRIDGADTEFLIFDRSTDSLISGSAKGERSSQVVGITPPIISLVLAATGFFIFSRSNPSPEIRTASLLFLMAAIAFAVAPGSLRSNPWALHIQEFGVQLAAALFFVYFSLLRGKSSSAWSVSSAARWGIAAWGLGSAVLYSVSVTSWPEIFDGLALIRFGLVAAAFLGGLGYLVNSYLQSDSPVTREQLRIMAFGITVPILFFVTFTVLPGVIGEDEIVPAEISVLGLIFVPLSFAYAIMRHEFMGIRRLVHRGAAYALISLAIFIIYGASLGITRAAGGSDLGDNVTVQILLLVALFAAIPFITGSRRLAFAAVDRLLYKEVVDHPDLTRRISIDAAHARHVDDLASNVLGTIARELQLTFAAFVDVTDGRANVKASSGTMPAALVGTLSSQ